MPDRERGPVNAAGTRKTCCKQGNAPPVFNYRKGYMSRGCPYIQSGRTRQWLDQWSELKADSFILKTVTRATLEFDVTPRQTVMPKQLKA